MERADTEVTGKLELGDHRAIRSVSRLGSQVIAHNRRRPPGLLRPGKFILQLEVAHMLNTSGGGEDKTAHHVVRLLIITLGKLRCAATAAGTPAHLRDPDRLAAAVRRDPAFDHLDPARNGHIEMLACVDQTRIVGGVINQPGVD